MSVFSEALRFDLLDHLFGAATRVIAVPEPWTVGLYRGDEDPLVSGDELTGTGYAGVTYANGTGRWRTVGAAGLENSYSINWTVGAGGWTLPGSVAPKVALRDGSDAPLIAVTSLTRDVLDWLVAPGPLTIPAGMLRVEWETQSTAALALSPAEGLAMLKNLMGGATWDAPSSWELGLWRGSPYAGGREVSDAAYDRITWTNDSSHFSPVDSTGKETLEELRWPATGSPVRSWGTVTHVCFCRAGVPLPAAAVKLAFPVPIGPGVPLVLPAGTVTLQWVD